MKQETNRRTGDRRDGRQIRNLPLADQYTPFFIRRRSEASNFYEDAVDITQAEFWLTEHAKGEFSNLNLLHVLIAAYVRTVSAMPAINRFVSGQRVYARNDITVVISAARTESNRRNGRYVKVFFEPSDNVYDVYRKIGSAVQQMKAGEANVGRAPFSETVLKLPRPLVRLAFWGLRVMDYFGRLPRQTMADSPYHGSLSVCSLPGQGVHPSYIGLGDFGNLSMSIALSTGQMRDRQVLNFRTVYDNRIADAHYFTEAFGYMKDLIRNPTLLEPAPESIFEDIF